MGYSPSYSIAVEAFEIAITLSSSLHLTWVPRGFEVYEQLHDPDTKKLWVVCKYKLLSAPLALGNVDQLQL